MENYETSQNDSVCRHLVWAHHRFFCEYHKLECMNPSRFGRLLRLAFPKVVSRRLGARSSTRYHYCGIRLRFDNLSGGQPTAVAQAQTEDAIAASELPFPVPHDIKSHPLSAEFAQSYRMHYGQCLVLLRYRQYEECMSVMTEFWKNLSASTRLWLGEAGHAEYVYECDVVFYDVRSQVYFHALIMVGCHCRTLSRHLETTPSWT